MPLDVRRGLQQAEYTTRKTVPIRPLMGQWTYDAAEDVPVGSSPDMMNCIVSQGTLRKRPGYGPYPRLMNALPGPVTGVYSTQDVNNITHAIAMWRGGGAKYNQATKQFDPLTGFTPTGTDLDLWDFETSQNSIVMSQGKDPVLRLPFTGLAMAPLNANCPPARYLARFNSRLNLGWTLEAGAPNPFRHRFSVALNHTDWVGLGAGLRDTTEFPYHMTNMKRLGQQLVIYYEKAIELATPQPVALAPFTYVTRVTDIGLYAPHTLKGRNDQHYFMGTDSFYTFNGVQGQDIAPQIRSEVFGSINASQVGIMFGEILYGSQEYVAFISTGPEAIPNTVWVYKWDRNIWYPWSVHGPRCSTTHRLDQSLTIDELIGIIDVQNWQFDSTQLLASFPALVTGDQDGKVYLWSLQYPSDAGGLIACRWTSHDFNSENTFGQGGHEITIERLEVHYQAVGNAALLQFYLSMNGGLSWFGPFPMQFVSLSNGVATGIVDQRLTGPSIRFKFVHESSTDTFAIIKFLPTFSLEETKVMA